MALFNSATILTDNYYYPKGVKGKRSENDLLIMFDETLFIIEVKAGNYTPDNPIINFDSHKRTIKSLIEKPDEQCVSLYNYLQTSSKIYDNDNEVKEHVRILDYKDVYMLSLTLENFNEIANMIEKFENISYTKGNMLMSIDDLIIHADSFSNQPYLFLDFLKYRKDATNFKELNQYDELDHLGLYIEYHDYPTRLEGILKEQESTNISNIFFDGARDELDSYYDKKIAGVYEEKPIPSWISKEILKFIFLLSKSKHKDKNAVIFGFLDSLLYVEESYLSDVEYFGALTASC